MCACVHARVCMCICVCMCVIVYMFVCVRNCVSYTRVRAYFFMYNFFSLVITSHRGHGYFALAEILRSRLALP